MEPSGVQEQNALIKVYPNPTRGNVLVEFMGIQKDVNYSIFDMNGKILYRGVTRNKLELDLGLSSYQNGLYILKAKLNGRYYSIKIAVRK